MSFSSLPKLFGSTISSKEALRLQNFLRDILLESESRKLFIQSLFVTTLTKEALRLQNFLRDILLDGESLRSMDFSGGYKLRTSLSCAPKTRSIL